MFKLGEKNYLEFKKYIISSNFIIYENINKTLVTDMTDSAEGPQTNQIMHGHEKAVRKYWISLNI